MQIPKILTIGAAVQDVFLGNSDEFNLISADPEHDFVSLGLGSKIDLNQINFATGGGATNAAITFARQGLKTSFMGIIGDDVAGNIILRNLDEEFIDTSRVEIDKLHSTDYSTILLAPNGERTILTYRGASSHIHANNFKLTEGEFDFIYITNLAGRFDAIRKIFTQASKTNTKIAWNPGSKELSQPEKVKTLLDDVELLIINKQEAQELFSGESIEELLRAGLLFVRNIIITDGQDGVWASDGKSIVRAGMYEDVKVIDRTGAGDAFGSGFVSQWVQGASLSESILFASANSTSVIQYVGSKDGILKKNAKLHSMPIMEKSIK